MSTISTASTASPLSTEPAENNYEEFTRLVHDALNRLYDSPHLHAHPLVEILIAPPQRSIQPSRELRRILLQAIHAMRPPPGTPAQSTDWRAYRILELRYLEGMSPVQAMEPLALSRSQFFRDQARILETLTQLLWSQRIPAAILADPQSRSELADSEVLRLSGDAKWEPTNVLQMVESLRGLLEPLARSKGGSIRFDLTQPMDDLPCDRVMLRQALLTALTYALYRAPGGSVLVESFRSEGAGGVGGAAGLTIRARAGEPPPAEHRQGVGLYIGQELMAALHGSLSILTDEPGEWAARLAWGEARSARAEGIAPILLVVDDNKEFALLCRRYLSAYAWQVVGAANTQEARRIAAEQRPSIILLDIMMPKEDGWELLTWFKSDPDLREIPVVVCSVLNEPELAAMLGAAAHLTKPVSQTQLLQTLARLTRLDASPEPMP